VATVILPSVADQRKQNIIQAVKEHGKRLLSFIRGRVDTDEDAEDILQDVWYQFTNLVNAEPVEQVGAWLYRVARNRIIDKYRKPKADSLDDVFPGDEEESFPLQKILMAEDVSPEAKQLQDLFWQQLFAALQELPEAQRRVFILNELEDISFNEIAEETGEKVNTLISRKRYAVLHLRKRLEELYKQIIQQ
jgi:RNA polymerase sigma factor (sigma-70 family)